MASTGDPTAFWDEVVNDVAFSLCNYLYVGVAGDVTCAVTDRSSGAQSNKLFKALAVGYHPIKTTLVTAAGTTATNILAAY